jgi:hypothetical protein
MLLDLTWRMFLWLGSSASLSLALYPLYCTERPSECRSPITDYLSPIIALWLVRVEPKLKSYRVLYLSTESAAAAAERGWNVEIVVTVDGRKDRWSCRRIFSVSFVQYALSTYLTPPHQTSSNAKHHNITSTTTLFTIKSFSIGSISVGTSTAFASLLVS